MRGVQHQIVATLKSRYPKVAALLSRMYALKSAARNERIAAASSERPLGSTELVSVMTRKNVGVHELPERLAEGDVIVARGVAQALGLDRELDALFQRAYGVPFADLGRIHELLTIEQILTKTQDFKNDPELLALECTLLRSLFPGSPELFVELMPNLRPHVPFELVDAEERRIERAIGRGKMNAHGPHKDSWRFHPANTINVWLSLTDATPLNGLFVLPASTGYCPKFANNEIVFGCATYPEHQYLTELTAGDAILFAAELVHGSVLNQTNRTRFAFSMRCTLETPKFHRDFMYNYVRLKPAFSNLFKEKLFSRSDFKPVSRDEFFTDLGRPKPALKIHETGPKAIVVEVDGELIRYPRRCPHRGADLTHATLDGKALVCPQHQLRIRPLDAGTVSRERSPRANGAAEGTP